MPGLVRDPPALGRARQMRPTVSAPSDVCAISRDWVEIRLHEAAPRSVRRQQLRRIVRQHDPRVEKLRRRAGELIETRRSFRYMHEVMDCEEPRSCHRLVILRSGRSDVREKVLQTAPHRVERHLWRMYRQVDVGEPKMLAVMELRR